MSKDTIAGAVKETGAKIRKNVDHAVGDYKGESQARHDEAAANVQKNFGKAKDAVKKTVDEALD